MNKALARISIFIMLAGIACSPLAGAADAALTGVVGNWLTEPNDGVIGIIQITVNAAGGLEGRIVGGNRPGSKDVHNKDPARRGAVLRGQVILKNMAYDGGGEWSGGTIYRAGDGKTFKCKVALAANGVLEVRGYIGFSLLGITQKWTRYTGTSMDLPQTQ